MTWTLKNRPTIPSFYSGKDKQIHSEQFDDLCACYKWFEGFERQERESAIRLLVCRAGGRINMFEAGMLYEKCLLLGLEDSRPGTNHEQEWHWQSLVLSCISEKEAEQKLKMILGEVEK